MVPADKEGYHEVPVSKAVQLTQDDLVKTAILLELDVSVSPDFSVSAKYKTKIQQLYITYFILV